MSTPAADPIDLWIKSLSPEEIVEFEERGRSTCCEVRESVIHGRGVFASRNIKEGELLFEYLGERISKKESDDRAWAQIDRANETGEASVLIFTLNEDLDIDGRTPWNLARYINHTCNPNAQAWIEDVELDETDEKGTEIVEERIYIYATTNIKENTEIGFNYGFDLENWKDHPCLCGTSNCVGYIAAEEYWDELQEKIAIEETSKSPLTEPSTTGNFHA